MPYTTFDKISLEVTMNIRSYLIALIAFTFSMSVLGGCDLFGPTVGTAVYVSTTGMDDNDGLSASTPVKTIQIGVNIAVKNNVKNVYLVAGEYTLGNGLLASGRWGVLITNNDILLSGGWNGDFTSQSGSSSLNAAGCVPPYRVVWIYQASGVSLNGLIISGGNYTNGAGAGVFVQYSSGCSIQNTEIRENNARYGAGVFAFKSDNNSFNATLKDNTASERGGGIYLEFCKDNTVSGDISGNYSSNNGGGIYLFGVTNATISSTVSDNDSVNSGGGMYIVYGRANNVGGNISANSANWGGGIYMDNTSANTITASINANSASAWGGGAEMVGGSGNTFDGSISGNTANNGGGGLVLSGSQNNTISGDISDNKAGGDGGGLYIEDAKANTINGTLANNIAPRGAGVSLKDSEGTSFLNTLITYAQNGYDVIETVMDIKDTIDDIIEVKNFILSNVIIGGNATGDLIREVAGTGTADVSGQTIVGSTFVTNATGALYRNQNGSTVNNPANLSTVGATTVSGNAASATLPVSGAPTLLIVSPKNGITLTNASVTVSGTASSANGIKKVTYAIDSYSYSPADGTTAWSFTKTLTEGNHTIRVMAEDNNGTVCPRQEVIIQVKTSPINQRPTFTILAPQNGQEFLSTNSSVMITLSVSAQGNSANKIYQMLMGFSPTGLSTLKTYSPTVLSTNWTFQFSKTPGVYTQWVCVAGEFGQNSETNRVVFKVSRPPALPSFTLTGAPNWRGAYMQSSGLRRAGNRNTLSVADGGSYSDNTFELVWDGASTGTFYGKYNPLSKYIFGSDELRTDDDAILTINRQCIINCV